MAAAIRAKAGMSRVSPRTVGIGRRLTPLGKAGPHHPEEQSLVLHRAGRRLPDVQANHAGGHFGLRQEARGGHVEEKLRLGVVIAEHGESAVIPGPGGGGHPLGHLLLNHDGDRGKAPGLQQGSEDRGGDIIGQVGAGHGTKSRKLCLHQSGDVHLQNILPEDVEIGVFP